MFRSFRFQILLGILFVLAFRLLAILIIPPTADEMIPLYMADDIAHFRQFPIYFYDQALLGSLESFYLAPFFKLFGFSYVVGRIAYLPFYLSFMALYLWTVRRLFNRELTVYLFILLSFLPFPALFFTTAVGMNETPMFVILSLILLLKLAEDVEGKSRWLPLGLGFVCGIAFWCYPLFIIWLVPIGFNLIYLIPAKRGGLLLRFGLGFAVGLFPVWLHGLQTGVFMEVGDRGGGRFVYPRDLPQMVYLYFARMKYFLSTFSFGSVSPWVDGLIRGFSLIPFLIFLTSFVSFAFYPFYSHGIQKRSEKLFYSFMVFPPIIFTFLYCSRNFTNIDEGMRFFLQLLIPYVFVVAWQMTQIHSRFWKKVCLSLLLGIILLGNIFSGREALRKGSEFREVIRFLEKERLFFGIAELATAYSLNALSDHQLIVTPIPHHAASQFIWEKVRKEGPRFLVLGHPIPRVRKELESDPNLKKATVGSYDIFYGESDSLTALLETPEPLF